MCFSQHVFGRDWASGAEVQLEGVCNSAPCHFGPVGCTFAPGHLGSEPGGSRCVSEVTQPSRPNEQSMQGSSVPTRLGIRSGPLCQGECSSTWTHANVHMAPHCHPTERRPMVPHCAPWCWLVHLRCGVDSEVRKGRPRPSAERREVSGLSLPHHLASWSIRAEPCDLFQEEKNAAFIKKKNPLQLLMDVLD